MYVGFMISGRDVEPDVPTVLQQGDRITFGGKWRALVIHRSNDTIIMSGQGNWCLPMMDLNEEDFEVVCWLLAGAFGLRIKEAPAKTGYTWEYELIRPE